MKISIIIPVYNSEQTIAKLVEEVNINLAEYDHEIILINDGSSDRSESVCAYIVKNSKHVQLISLRKNFGEHNAVLCGLNFATGNYCLIMDDDFQNPPTEIIKLLNEIENGYDVVYSKYDEKQHTFFRNMGSKIHNRIANLLLSKPRSLYLSSFKIIERNIVNEIIKYLGPFPYIDGLILRTTNNIGTITVAHFTRTTGKSKYTPFKLFALFFNMFLNFSLKPLRIFTFCGFIIFLCGCVLSGYFLFQKLTSQELPGWTSTVLFILLLSGFQIIFLGVIGEYIGKQYLDQNKTPQWVIKKIVK